MEVQVNRLYFTCKKNNKIVWIVKILNFRADYYEINGTKTFEVKERHMAKHNEISFVISLDSKNLQKNVCLEF